MVVRDGMLLAVIGVGMGLVAAAAAASYIPAHRLQR
jgi:hypothetical protein